MAKPGVWGANSKIYTPILYKRVSCATCEHYCRDDHSCMATAIVPKVDGYDYWKKCKNFMLDIEYNDADHQDQVRRVKGDDFFVRLREQKKDVVAIDAPRENAVSSVVEVHALENVKRLPANVVNEPKCFSEKVLYSLWHNHNLEVTRIGLVDSQNKKDAVGYVNPSAKILIVTLPQIKPNNKNFSKETIKAMLWNRFGDSIKPMIHTLLAVAGADDYEKWIILPVINYSETSSCAEEFYRMNGKCLQGIKLVELDGNGNLRFATGPMFDKYWTAEKIHNLKVFKD